MQNNKSSFYQGKKGSHKMANSTTLELRIISLRVKSEATNYQKIFSTHIFDKELLSGIHKDLLQSIRKLLTMQ